MKHTKGAMQAAEKIMESIPTRSRWHSERFLELSEIIDRETGLLELLDAAKQALRGLRSPQSYETEQHIAGVLDAAIKKVEGEK